MNHGDKGLHLSHQMGWTQPKSRQLNKTFLMSSARVKSGCNIRNPILPSLVLPRSLISLVLISRTEVFGPTVIMGMSSKRIMNFTLFFFGFEFDF